MQGFRPRATAGREEGLPQSPPHRPRRSRRSAYIPAAVPLFPDAPFPAAPKPRCLVVPLPRCPFRPVVPFGFCPRLLRLPPCPKTCCPCPKTALLGSQARKNAHSYPKTGHFGVPKPDIQRCRWAKQALLPIRARKNSSSLGKTGVFAQRRRGERPLPFRGNAWVTGRSTRGRRDRRKDRRREPRGQLRRAKT